MKFLLICSFLPSIINFRGKLLEAIAAKGYEIHILAPDTDQFQEDFQTLTQLGYHIHNIPMQRAGTNPIADAKTLKVLYTTIKAIKPDYVLSYTIKPVIYGTLAARMAKVPHIFAMITGLGYAFQTADNQAPSTTQKLIYSLYKKALPNCEKIIFQNPDDLALFRHLRLMPNNFPTVLVNGSGVNLTHFEVIDLPRDQQGNVKISFLLIARLLKDKGVVEYIEAAKIIKQQYPNIEFHLVGWMDENPNAITQAQLDDWVSQGIVKFWGKLADVRPSLAECSVYVLPSYREGTPRTVLEAMAMGRTIITTNAPGCKETVVDGVNGFLVPVKAVKQLADAMEKFILEPNLVIEMGKASRKIVVEKFDVNKVNQTMLIEMGL
ncbi:glycosyltransferase family 4 protein [Moraxella sp. DOX410]|nr:glycosyltransferase family 4 protein [Moraxella sp. DOX410]WNP28410.1 glycosyltransferase family 4 protein [Moraxella sp. DOX410]